METKDQKCECGHPLDEGPCYCEDDGPNLDPLVEMVAEQKDGPSKPEIWEEKANQPQLKCFLCDKAVIDCECDYTVQNVAIRDLKKRIRFLETENLILQETEIDSVIMDLFNNHDCHEILEAVAHYLGGLIQNVEDTAKCGGFDPPWDEVDKNLAIEAQQLPYEMAADMLLGLANAIKGRV